MGNDLVKQLFAFEQLGPADGLVAAKLRSNAWEDEYRRLSDAPEERPINIDPGYVTEAKLVLATTKDRDHRIYLGDGIYAEVTTYYRRGEWQPREWTYADYRRAEVTSFLDQCRQYLRVRYKSN